MNDFLVKLTYEERLELFKNSSDRKVCEAFSQWVKNTTIGELTKVINEPTSSFMDSLEVPDHKVVRGIVSEVKINNALIQRFNVPSPLDGITRILTSNIKTKINKDGPDKTFTIGEFSSGVPGGGSCFFDSDKFSGTVSNLNLKGDDLYGDISVKVHGGLWQYAEHFQVKLVYFTDYRTTARAHPVRDLIGFGIARTCSDSVWDAVPLVNSVVGYEFKGI